MLTHVRLLFHLHLAFWYSTRLWRAGFAASGKGQQGQGVTQTQLMAMMNSQPEIKQQIQAVLKRDDVKEQGKIELIAKLLKQTSTGSSAQGK